MSDMWDTAGFTAEWALKAYDEISYEEWEAARLQGETPDQINKRIG